MKNLLMIFQALFLGAKLKKSATWKNWGAFVAVFAPVLTLLGKLGAGYGWLPAEFTEEQINDISQWVWQGSGLLLAYWFQSTSADVGLGKSQEIGYQMRADYEEQGVVGESVGVLHTIPELYVHSGSKTNRHAGDDPTLDSFN